MWALVLVLLVDHVAELPVVQLLVPAGVELGEGHPHLLVTQVLADRHELLKLIVDKNAVRHVM